MHFVWAIPGLRFHFSQLHVIGRTLLWSEQRNLTPGHCVLIVWFVIHSLWDHHPAQQNPFFTTSKHSNSIFFTHPNNNTPQTNHVQKVSLPLEQVELCSHHHCCSHESRIPEQVQHDEYGCCVEQQQQQTHPRDTSCPGTGKVQCRRAQVSCPFSGQSFQITWTRKSDTHLYICCLLMFGKLQCFFVFILVCEHCKMT